jgi:MoxR-like ATPase
MAILTATQREIVKHLNAVFGETVTRGQLMDYYKKGKNHGILPRWLMTPEHSVSRGIYSLVESTTKLDPAKPFPSFKQPTVQKAVQEAVAEPAPEMAEAETSGQVVPMVRPTKKSAVIAIGGQGEESFVPDRYRNFVPFGNYDDVYRVIKASVFYPVFITGLSGNGKTMMVEQACAMLGREMIRVQITPESDEDDLIGGFRMIDGETVWFDGPVTIAAIRGAVCLIDEIDYGTGKISCLQGILEGKGIHLKKVNRFVPLADGFNIIATANTKGRGAEENGARYVNTQLMNEALLERFGITLEQEFPTMKTEQKILEKELAAMGRPDEEFAAALVKWAEVIRRSFDNQAVEDVISTRRLVHIVRAFGIFGDKLKAVEKCLNRFDRQTRDSFLELYTKVSIESAGGSQPEAQAQQVTQENDGSVSVTV